MTLKINSTYNSRYNPRHSGYPKHRALKSSKVYPEMVVTPSQGTA